MYAGTDIKGILKTTDGGANWRDAGLKGQTITGLTLDPSNTDILYATTPTWEGGVFKNEDGGRSRSWRSINAGTPPVGTGHEFSTALALDPRNPATIYVATKGDLPSEEGGGVSKSLDGGRSWRSTNAGLNGARVSALALAPGSPGMAYAAVAGRGVFKRADGRWRAVNTGPMNSWRHCRRCGSARPGDRLRGHARRHLQEHERRRELAGFIHGCSPLPRRRQPGAFRGWRSRSTRSTGRPSIRSPPVITTGPPTKASSTGARTAAAPGPGSRKCRP